MMYNEVREQFSTSCLWPFSYHGSRGDIMSEELKEELDQTIDEDQVAQNKTEDPGDPEGEVGEKMLLRMNDHHKELRDWGFSFINWVPGMEILDIGCGGGAAISEMLKLSEGSIVKGIDKSYKSIEVSVRQNAQAIAYERCSVKQYDVMDMPYIDNAYDLVTAIETVYFWEDPVIAFQHVRKVLKPGGSFAVLAETGTPSPDDATKFNTPMKVYTASELEEIMKKAGFSSCVSRHGDNDYLMVEGIK